MKIDDMPIIEVPQEFIDALKSYKPLEGDLERHWLAYFTDSKGITYPGLRGFRLKANGK